MGFLRNKQKTFTKKDNKFIGRETELAALKYSLKQFNGFQQIGDYPSIFYIFGKEGSGKTLLLNQLIQSCEQGDLGFIPFIVFLDCKDIKSNTLVIENFLISLKDKIIEKDQTLKSFFIEFEEVWNKYQTGTLPSDYTPPENFDSKETVIKSSNLQGTMVLKKSAPQLTQPTQIHKITPSKTFSPGTPSVSSSQLKAAYTPLGNIEITKLKSGQIDIQAIAKNLTQAIESLKKDTKKETIIDIKSVLLNLFSLAIDRISNVRRIVLIIDSYEEFEENDKWFRGKFLNSFRKELIIIISGKNDLTREYKNNFEKLVNCLYIREFTLFETENYLREFISLNDPTIISGVYTLSKGLPISISMLSGAIKSFRGNESKIKEFLEYPQEMEDKLIKYIIYIMLDYIPKGDRNLLILLSYLRKFDENLFAELSGVLNPQKTLEKLATNYTFINTRNYKLHDLVKKTIRIYTKKELPEVYQEINQDALDYYSDRLRENPEDTNFLIDALYYYFHIEEDMAYKHLLMTISHYLQTNIDFCEVLTNAMMDCQIKKETKINIKNISESLVHFRHRDYKGSQTLLEAISKIQQESSKLQFLEF